MKSVEVDKLFSGWNKPGSPGFSLAVIQNGEIIYKHGYGIANLDHDIPITSQTVFDIGSTSKQFTAASILLLSHQGKLFLDDNIQKYIPEMTRYEHPVTVRHLIHHTSGIRDYLTLMELAGLSFENEYPDDEVIGLIARQKELNFNPGDEFLYCNSGYLLLAEIVRHVSGRSLAEYAKEHIFDPLGMNSTHFHDDHTMIVKNSAIGYSPKDDGGFRVDMSIFDVVGDGCLYTTVEDLYLWDVNFYKNKLGGYGQSFIDELITPGSLNNGQTLDYAFGLTISSHHGLKTISHGGAWMGYRAEFVRFPDERFSVICLSNLGTANPEYLARQVAELYLSDRFTEQRQVSHRNEPQVSKIKAEELENKAGYYHSRNTMEIWGVSIMNGKLILDSFGENIPMESINSSHFINEFYEIEIKFESLNRFTVQTEHGFPEIYNRLNIVHLDQNQLREYAGDYHCDELGVKFHISISDGELQLKHKGAPRESLKPTEMDLMRGKSCSYQFIRDEKNQINGFLLGAGRVKNIRFLKNMENK